MTIALAVRPEDPADQAAIQALHRAAFGQEAEADLVDRLRLDQDLVLSLVAGRDRILGHIAFSRMVLDSPMIRVSALAPVSVLPEAQHQGIGSALIRDGLSRLAAMGEDMVVVLGEPAFYGRFGFAAEAVRDLRTPYDGPYLQGLSLSGRAVIGPARYPGAFAGLA
ncbi:GNAT family N-acetyltransferase [Microvirga pudoricolor]|uniref:GNAT family N-acetyltransferase n=1 Tax=Microvirga pudoricolor TaxID=2778729 RepID=UPI001951D373|nr:N-acetyltransferase [Microvirga pudoricolor]MBM6596214.1 N-acetyltransferase [Microvirga pudoricolor]